MRRSRTMGLNEIMIVNPSRNGDMGMMNGTNGQHDESGAMGWYGMGGGIGRDDIGAEPFDAISDEDELGAIPMDELGAIPLDELGGISADELEAGFCTSCGGEQLGYYGNDEDRELIGRYCPACSGGAAEGPMLGGLVGDYGTVLADDELTGLLGEEGGEEALYDALMADDENYHGPPDDGTGEDLVGGLYADIDEELEHQAMQDTGVLGRYVPDNRRAPLDAPNEFGPLSGYEREKSVNASVELRRTVPRSPLQSLPQIFRPHF